MDLVAENRRPAMTSTERRTVALILVLMAILSFWLASNRTFDPVYIQPDEPFNTDFYRQQAISMLNGRLDVPYQQYRYNECFFRESRCYGYFGLVPSILRLPGFLLTGSTDLNPSPVMIAAGTTIALWAAIDLALGFAGAEPTHRRLNPTNRLRLIVLTALTLGPGGILVFLSQAKIYYEAIVLMIAALLITFTLIQRWIFSPRPIFLVAALSSAVVATNARPAALLPTVILGLGVLLLTRRTPVENRRKNQILGLGITILPTATALGVTWLKLQTITPMFSTYGGFDPSALKRILEANGGSLQGLRFLPTNLVNYLRPDSLQIDSSWPWFSHAVPVQRAPLLLPPIKPGGVYTELTASVTNTMPVALGITIVAIVLLVSGCLSVTKTQLRSITLLGIAGVSCVLTALLQFAMTSRYLGDFYPFLTVGTAFGLVALLESVQSGSVMGRMAGLIIATSSVPIFIINVALQQQAFFNPG